MLLICRGSKGGRRRGGEEERRRDKGTGERGAGRKRSGVARTAGGIIRQQELG
jgi:hypothetical protein